MDPLTFLVLIAFSLILALGLLIFAPGFLLVHGPLLAACWSAGMILYVALDVLEIVDRGFEVRERGLGFGDGCVGCAYLSAWLEDVLEAQKQAELERWRERLDREHA